MNRPSVLQVGGTLYWVILTRDPDTMVLKDADSTPTVAVRKNGASTADSVTITKRSATTGIYDCSYNPAGEVEGDKFTFEESATVTGTTTSSATYRHNWDLTVIAVERGTDSAATSVQATAIETDTQDIQSRLPAALVSGRIDASVGNMESNVITSSVIATGAITASAIQTNAITDDKLAASAITEIQSGLATTAQLTTVENKVDAIDDFVDTEVAAIKATTDKLDTTVELDGVVYRFTANALEQAPSGGGGGGTSIMVTPVVAQTPVRVIGSNIETFIGDLSDIRVGIFSGTDPVDLSGFGDLEVCVQERDGTDLDLVPMADITIDGDSNEYVTWTPNGPSVSQVRRGKWSLRKTSNKQVIGYGSWIVVDAALGDGS